MLIKCLYISTAEQYFDKYSWAKQFRCAYKPVSEPKPKQMCSKSEKPGATYAGGHNGPHICTTMPLWLAGIIIMGEQPLTGERE